MASLFKQFLSPASAESARSRRSRRKSEAVAANVVDQLRNESGSERSRRHSVPGIMLSPPGGMPNILDTIDEVIDTTQ